MGVGPAVGVADTSPPGVLAILNSLREAHGLPGGVVEDPAKSHGCALHNAYQRLNGHFGHFEYPGSPGYSLEGLQAAGSSVLARGSWQQGNPFELAPLHLVTVLAPQLSVLGVDETADYVCMWFVGGYGRSGAENVVIPYPSQGSTVAVAEQAMESPFVPGDFVGLPMGTRTGPHLYVFADGPFSRGNSFEGMAAMRLVDARLVGPDGPLEVRFVDNTMPTIGRLVHPAAAIVIPVAPLRGDAEFSAQVIIENPEGVRLSRSWSFRTAPLPNALFASLGSPGGNRLHVLASSEAPNPDVTLSGVGVVRRIPVAQRSGTIETDVHVTRSGTYELCVTSGGQLTGYEVGRTCDRLSVRVRPPRPARLSVPRRIVALRPVPLSVRFGEPVARGRIEAQIRVRRGFRTLKVVIAGGTRVVVKLPGLRAGSHLVRVRYRYRGEVLVTPAIRVTVRRAA